MEPIVHGLEQEYADRMKFEIRPYADGDSPALIKKYALGQHGMVITDSAGTLVWSESGHRQTAAGVERAVLSALDG